jgi:protein arginine kinase
MRASVMLHLPGLGAVRTELKKVFHAAQHTGLAVRGLHGEGSRAAGDLYQVSNQVTLGATEEQLVERLLGIVERIVAAERAMREALLEDRREALKDRVARSLATLRTSMSMQTEAALRHLSWVRLGHHLDLVQGLDIGLLNRLAVQIQRGHLQALHGTAGGALLEPSERRKLRASLLRSAFSGRG